MTDSELNTTMKRSISWVDRFAIGVSALCVLHCLVTPLLILALPSLASSIIAGESLHIWLVYAVIPSSVFALTLGCKQHKRRLFMVLGGIGLVSLLLGVNVEALGLDHHWEQIFTIAGASLVALAHALNFRQCRLARDCCCD